MADLRIAQPLTLKSGVKLPNRLVKAAMAEAMATDDGIPGSNFTSPDGAYAAWAAGGWGMTLTGNVQVDERHLGQGNDTFCPATVDDAALTAWKAWAKTCSAHGVPTIVQINHPGKQSPAGKRGYFEKPISPSAVPLKLGPGFVPWVLRALVFGSPRAMTQADIDHVVSRFAATARLSADAGFAGVEVHAAHGYLLSQFMSPRSNTRTDKYGGSPANRVRIIVDIIKAVHAATSHVPGFSVSIKLNSVDHQAESDLKDSIEQLKLIEAAGVDFIEISGGSYEDPTMSSGTSNIKGSSLNSEEKQQPQQKSERTKAREAFFLEFAQAVRSSLPDTPLMVTGGFRSRSGMEHAVASGACEMVGVGRPAVLDPGVAHKVLDKEALAKGEEVRLYARKIEAPAVARWLGLGSSFVGAGTETKWYADQIKEFGKKLLGVA